MVVVTIRVGLVRGATPMVVPGVSSAQELNKWERVKASAFVGFDDMSLERCDGCVTGWSWCRKD